MWRSRLSRPLGGAVLHASRPLLRGCCFFIASAVALAEVGLFRETVQYVQKAAKALYESAREVLEQVKVSLQRLAELFVEAVTRVLAWVDEHKAYLFLMAAGAVALGVALNMWGVIELEKLAYAASLTPFVAGLADAGGKAAERFKALAERWKVDDNENEDDRKYHQGDYQRPSE
jgi:hypothetical protein